MNKQDSVTEIAEKAVSQQHPDATFAALVGKPRRRLDFPITLADEDGEPLTMQMRFLAITPKEYDKLVSEFPPSEKEKRNGALFDADTFPAALIAACSSVPKLSYEQALEIWNSPTWSNGEASSLFINAQRVCNSGIDVPFNGRD